MNKRVWRILSLITVLALMVASFGMVGAQDEMGKVLYLNWGEGDVPSVDPSIGTDTSSIQIVMELFPGLTSLNEVTVELEDGMGTFTVSDDGLTYTFSLLQEVPWVQYNMDSGEVEMVMDDAGNGRYVTAADFKYGMMRSMAPETASYYGGILASWVAGGAAYNSGEGAAEDVQINVVDDYTLEIVAPEPAAFLPNILGMWMAVAQPSWVVEEFGDLWTEPEYIQSYGPFAMSEWLHGESLTLVKNPFWAGTDSIPAPKLDAVVGTMLDGNGELANYEAGLLDVASPLTSELDRIKADPVLSQEYTVAPGSCTYYYGFNTTVAPFDDVRVRQAFSMGLDRQALIDNVLKAGQEPAFFFSRPNLVAAPTADAYPEYVIGEDYEAAKALLDEYVAENGALPTVTLMHNESSGHALIAAAVQEMWRDNLGVEDIQVTTQEWAVYLDTIKDAETAPGLWRLGWCLDYPDTHNFLFDVFHSSVAENGTGWYNPEFDALLDAAKGETDLQVRTDLYAQAENLLTNEEAVIIPVYFYTSSRLTKPYVERTYPVAGHNHFERWDLNR